MLVLGLMLIWSAPPARGSELATSTNDYTIENWQVEQGLPHITVTSVAQTPDGYLWLGTFNGLARFDGVRFTIFDEGNTPALGNSAVTQLQVDGSGTLWILTQTGALVRMCAGRFAMILKENARLLVGEVDFSPNAASRLLLLDRKGDWYELESEHLLPLGANELPQFFFENTGNTWIAEQGKLTSAQQRQSPVLTAEGGNTNRVDLVIRSAAVSQAGGYWVSTDTGIYRLRDGQLSTRQAPLPPGVTKPVGLKEDGQGHLWAAQWGKGVYRWDARGSWQLFCAGAGLTDNHVNCLFRDREGSLWVGTGQGGLHRFRPRVFRTYHTENGSASDVVMSVTQDRQGQLWFAVNGGGLHAWTNGGLRPVANPVLARSSPLAYSVLADSQNAVWIGLYGLNTLRWSAGTVTAYDLDDGSHRVMTPRALFEDRAGTIWLGCTHGLLRYTNGPFDRYTAQVGLSCDTVAAFAEDRSGGLYLGTDGGGLNYLHQGRFSVFTERDGLADNHISSLYLDPEDTLWIGTVNNGLGRLKQGRFSTVRLKDGLPSNTIGGLLEDDQEHLWLGSNRWIIRVDRSALNDYLDGKRHSVVWQVFGLSDGLSTLGCAGGGQPVACKARDGTLWFATIKGVAVVDPNRLPFNPLPPPVAIEEVVMDDRVTALQGAGPEAMPMKSPGPAVRAATSPAAVGETPEAFLGAGAPVSSPSGTALTVPPRTHRLEFHFTGLSLAAPEKVRFQYRLEPFDHDWVQADTRRVAYYTGIPPGRYQFRVIACNNSGLWNLDGARLGLEVLPPWWRTWWFRALMVTGAAGLLLGWYEWRLNRLRRERLAQETFSRSLIASQENERRRIAGELHDELGQDLLVIASQAQLGLSQTEHLPVAAARLKDIADTAKHALQQARRMAHNLRPGLLEELGFRKAVRATLSKAAQASGLSMVVDLAEVDGLLPPEFEVNLFRITQESLNNILKHAHATEVKVSLSKEPAALRLVVEDNGCGFELSRLEASPPDQRGLGLPQIAERAKMMGGHIELQSRPGQGTKLTVEVPLRASRPPA